MGGCGAGASPAASVEEESPYESTRAAVRRLKRSKSIGYSNEAFYRAFGLCAGKIIVCVKINVIIVL